jgi:hypothetical protein
VSETLTEVVEPTPAPPEPEPEPAPEPEPEPAPEPASRCEAETTVGGNLYRCALETDHEDDHRFQTVDEPALSSDDGEAAVNKAIPKLEAEAARHAKRIIEIMGDDAAGLCVCELCLPAIPGYRWDGAPDAATTEAVRIAIGLPDLSNFRPSATEAVCDDCSGLGKVRTGSHVAKYETATCDACQGKGYRHTRERLNPAPEPEPLAAAANGATVYPDDGVKRDMFGTPETDPDYGKMPNMRERPVDYWSTHRE